MNTEANGEEAAGFDVREVLVPVEEVADIRVTNGNTGTVFMVGTQEEKEQILEAYAALDIRPEEELQQRIGYSYRIQLLDANGNVLQNVTPYKDAVTLDGEIYDGSMNQTTTALLLAVSAHGNDEYKIPDGRAVPKSTGRQDRSEMLLHLAAGPREGCGIPQLNPHTQPVLCRSHPHMLFKGAAGCCLQVYRFG